MLAARYDPQEFAKQWADALKRAAAGKAGVGIGTVLYMAQQGGYSSPAATNQPVQPSSVVPQWVTALNKNYAWIEAQASIYRLDHSDFIEPAKFRIQLDNKTVPVPSANGIQKRGMGTTWLKHADRRQHKALVLRPAAGLVTSDNCLNEWRGFAVDPATGDIRPFLRLLMRLVPRREARRYVLHWLAHLLLHPEIKLHVSLAVWSQDQGVGKNLLFECLTSIIGPTHSTVIGQSELSSTFNGWAHRKFLIIGDEVSSTDRRHDRDKLKGLITGAGVYLNEKYQPAREVPNLLNFIFLSNHHDALFLDDRDRRFFVWEITAPRLPEIMSKQFVQWRDSGGLAALHYFLLRHDTTGFNPKAAAPMTDAKAQMAQDNRSDLENWIAELMGSNVSQIIGRELATANELAKRYALDTGHRTPSAKTIVGACKKNGASARTNQVRLANGKKVRVLALARSAHWLQQPEADWASEMAKIIKWG